MMTIQVSDTFFHDLEKEKKEIYNQALEDYRKWMKDSPCPEYDNRPCDGMCIDCFIRMEKEQKDDKAE